MLNEKARLKFKHTLDFNFVNIYRDRYAVG